MHGATKMIDSLFGAATVPTTKAQRPERLSALRSAAVGLPVGGVGEARFFSSPGCINLMGEHGDDDGLALPAAIDHGVLIFARARFDDDVVLLSLPSDEPVRFSIGSVAGADDRVGSRRAHAVIDACVERGIPVRGLELVLSRDPSEANGTSSSSTALTLGLAAAITAVGGSALTPGQLAHLARRAEQLAGGDDGIIAPWATTHARAGQALLLDGRSLEYELVPLELGGHVFLVAGGGQRLPVAPRGERRAADQEIVRLLNAVSDRILINIRDVAADDVRRLGSALPAPLRARALHMVEDNARVVDAAAALREGVAGLHRFGALLDAADDALAELTGPAVDERDAMVALIKECGGAAVVGARRTLDGATLSLVRKSFVAGIVADVDVEYRRTTGLVPSFTVAVPADGLRELLD